MSPGSPSKSNPPFFRSEQIQFIRRGGQAAFALIAERGTGKYVGSALITPNPELSDRLWKRVQKHANPALKVEKRPATQLVKPGVGRPCGEEDLRHASLQDSGKTEPSARFELMPSRQPTSCTNGGPGARATPVSIS
jgi:hypothetical protein